MLRGNRWCVDAYRRRQLQVEPLESRRLLSVNSHAASEASAANWSSSTLNDAAWLRPASVADRAEAALSSQVASDALVSAVESIVWRGESMPVMAGRWIVKFDSSAAPQAGAALAAGLAPLANLGFGIVGHLGSNDTFLIQSPSATPHQEIVDILSDVPGFRFAEPDTLLTPLAITPNDPSYPSMWALNNLGQTGGVIDADIDAPEAWNIHTGSGGTVVAILDSGINYIHIDLQGNIWINPGEIAGNGIDDDGNGYIDDLHGVDFVNGDSDPWDDEGHGTAVAGIMGAVGNNGIGIAGINWDVQIMALKVFGPGDQFTVSGAVAAFQYVNMMKRDYGINIVVTNNSWGATYSEALREAMGAGEPLGILHAASAGNQTHDNDVLPQYPATFGLDNIISVAATDHRDQRAGFSSYGLNTVHLGAPGVSTLTTSYTGGYQSFGGTSAASPHVAGAVALLFDAFPGATYQEVRDAIFAGVTPIASMSGVTVTGGRLNVAGAMQQMGLRVVAATPGDGQVVSTLPTDFTVQMRPAFDPLSVQPGDLLVNATPADLVFISGDTITFRFNSSPVVAEGLQSIELAAGSIRRQLDGVGNTAFQTTFRYDVLPLAVVSLEPAVGSTAALPLSEIEVTFNEDVDPLSIDIHDLILSQGTVVGINILEANRVAYQIDGIAYDGVLLVRMKPGTVTDDHGNPNLAFVGELDLDVVESSANDFERIGPAGGLVFGSLGLQGTINAAGDQDDYTFFVEAGQTITAVVDFDQLGHTLDVELLGLPVTASASATAGTIVVGPLTVESSSTLTLRLSGEERMAYRVDLYRNAAVHTDVSTTDVDASYVDLGDAGRWGFVHHATATSSSVHDYTVDLAYALGHTVDIAVDGFNGTAASNVTLQLISPSGAPVATGLGALSDILIEEPGRYTLRVDSGVAGSYAGTITDRLAFDLEFNDDPLGDTIRSLDGVRGAVGYVDHVPREGVFEFVLDTTETLLALEGGILSGGVLIPLEPQAANSLIANVLGSLLVDVTADTIRFVSGLSIETIPYANSFQPGSSPASLAGQVTLFTPNLYIAVRNVGLGVVSAAIPLDSLGNFVGSDLTLELGGTITAFAPGLLSESVGGLLQLENDLAPQGNLERTESQLRLVIPIGTEVVIPFFGPLGGVLSVVGQIVAVARLPRPLDVYEITLTEGQSITVATKTLFGQSSATPSNSLNPKLVIRNSAGGFLASDDDSGVGTDALLTFVAPADGVYRIAVEAVAGAGEYLLTVDGHGGSEPAPLVVTTVDPPDGTALNVAPSAVEIQLNGILDVESLDADDLLVDGQPAQTVTLVTPNTVRFEFAAPLGEGSHTVSLAANRVLNILGTGNDAFSSTFVVDTTGPRIIASSVDEGETINVGPFSYEVQFDESISLGAIRLDTVVLFNQTTGQVYPATGLSFNTNTFMLGAEFGALSEGNYVLTLVSGSGGFEDLLGNELDGEAVGAGPGGTPSGDGIPGGSYIVNFVVDLGLVEASPFQRVEPLGSLVLRSTGNSGLVNFAGDNEEFRFLASAGELLSATVWPEQGDELLTIEVVGVAGPYAAAAAGLPATLSNVVLPYDGEYRVRVSGYVGGGTYQLTLHRNAVIESEDSSSSDPLSLEPSRLDVGVVRYAAVGTSSPTYLATDAVVWGVQPATGEIVTIDPATGTVVNRFAAPDALAPHHTHIGLSIADAGATLLYVNSDLDPTALYRLDSATGVVLSIETTSGGTIDGLAYSSYALLDVDFESGLEGFTINNGSGSSTGLWHLSNTGRAFDSGHTATSSLYYGQNESVSGGGNYNTGSRNLGSFTSAPIYLPASGSIQLSFNYFLQTEGSRSWDIAEVAIGVGSVFTTVLSSGNGSLPTGTNGIWSVATADLSAYAGQEIVVRFSFDTRDSAFNQYEGWYIDDILVQWVPTSSNGDLQGAAYLGISNVEVRRQDLASGTFDVDFVGLAPTGGLGGDGSGRLFGFFTDGYIREFQPQTGSIVNVFAAPAVDIEGMAHSGGSLFVSTASGQLYTLDADTGSVVNVITLPTGAFFGLGSSLTPGGINLPDDDVYAVELKAGQVVDIVVDGDVTGLELFDVGGGAILAHGSTPTGPGTNYDSAITGYIVPAHGIYTVRVRSASSGDYGLLVTTATFDLEPNDTSDLALDLTVSHSALGFLSTTSADHDDYYRVYLHAGQPVSIATSTPLPALNELDPAIELLDAQGNIIAWDDDSAGDGRNGRLVFAPTTSDFYTIRVHSTAEGSLAHGEYVLSIDRFPAARITGPSLLVGAQPGTFHLSAISPTAAHQPGTFTYELDWDGDGSVDEIVSGAEVAQVHHAFAGSGWFDVTVVARDQAGQFSGTGTHRVLVVAVELQPDPEAPGQFNVVWTGTEGDDHVEIVELTPSLVLVRILKLDGIVIDPTVRVYNSPVNGRIIAHGLGGDDVIDANNLVSIPIEIHGGPGHDRLIGGSANDLIFGDPNGPRADGAEGRDWIDGGGGNDIIYGDGAEGAADTILGGSGDDLIFAGPDGAEGMRDQVSGGNGDDLIIDYGARSSLDGGDDNDVIVAGIDGGEGRSQVVGGNGDDTLIQFSATGALAGMGGDDLLLTRSRGVKLSGGDGQNVMVVDAAVAAEFLPGVARSSDTSSVASASSEREATDQVIATDEFGWYAYTLLQETFDRWNVEDHWRSADPGSILKKKLWD